MRNREIQTAPQLKASQSELAEVQEQLRLYSVDLNQQTENLSETCAQKLEFEAQLSGQTEEIKKLRRRRLWKHLKDVFTDKSPGHLHDQASLIAFPLQVPVGGIMGATEITWSTGDDCVGEVYVSVNGGPEMLFATGPQNSKEAPWILADQSYEFRLYAGTDRMHLLDKAPVTGVRIPLSATPEQSEEGFTRFVECAEAGANRFAEEDGSLPALGEIAPAAEPTLVAFEHAQQDEISAPSEQNEPVASLYTVPPTLDPAFEHAQQDEVSSPSEQNEPVVSLYKVPPTLDPYDAWLEVNQWNSRREKLLREQLSRLVDPPLLSVVMPVFNPSPDLLDKAISSVANQIYPHWELCIVDDASSDPSVGALLQEWAELEPRIRLKFGEGNGNFSRATNSAAELATGEYLVLMDQADEIPPEALGEMALDLAAHPQTDILYSDSDKIDLDGRRFDPQFKPDWSPELLLSYMYFSHPFVLRQTLFFDVKGVRVGFEGSLDYDLALRAVEKTRRVDHIPKVLYHWRADPGSTPPSGPKPNFLTGVKALQEALDRRGVTANATQPDWAVTAQSGIFSLEFPDHGPRVVIIIPTKNGRDVLKSCLDSLAKTTYQNYEVIVVDNESDDPETLEFLKQTHHRVLRFTNPDGKFNYAAMINRAAEFAECDYLLFLNHDMEVISPEWLSQMTGYLGMQGVGAVGARLLHGDQRIQHAGIVHGYYDGMVGPAFRLLPASDNGYLSYAMVTRNYSAVTGACMLTRRDLFLEVGGFDEKNFAVAYNDVDYCYRLREAGHRIVYCPRAELIHQDRDSLGFMDNPAEPGAFRQKYGCYRDPYYNPNLSLDHERFGIESVTIAPEKLAPIPTLMCAHNLNWEGAPYSQYEVTVRLKEERVIDPIVYSPTEGPLRQAYEAKGIQVEVFDYPLAGVCDAAGYREAIENFADRINDFKVDVVYGNTLRSFYAIDSSTHLGLPSIWNARESEPWQTYFDYLGPEIAPFALRCFHYPYKVVFVANATHEGCKDLNTHHNFATIKNGLDESGFHSRLGNWPREVAREKLNIPRDAITVLLLGTVCERKGQIDLIEAIARLDARQLRCFIVGDRENDYSKRLHSIYEGLPPTHQKHIAIVPETAETALYYSSADIFVCTSRIESYPRVILEAMSCGLPIITTPVFGVREQVQQNINALFYEPGDTRALSESIMKLATDQEFRLELAGNSRLVLNTLTNYEEMVNAYAKIFRGAWLSGMTRTCAEFEN